MPGKHAHLTTQSPAAVFFRAQLVTAQNNLRLAKDKWDRLFDDLKRNPEPCVECADAMWEAEQKLMVAEIALEEEKAKPDPVKLGLEERLRKAETYCEKIHDSQQKLNKMYVDWIFGKKDAKAKKLKAKFPVVIQNVVDAKKECEEARQALENYLDDLSSRSIAASELRLESNPSLQSKAEESPVFSLFLEQEQMVASEDLPLSPISSSRNAMPEIPSDLFKQLAATVDLSLTQFEKSYEYSPCRMDVKRERSVKNIRTHISKSMEILNASSNSSLDSAALFLIAFNLIKLECEVTQRHHKMLRQQRLFSIGRAESSLAKKLRLQIIENPEYLALAKKLQNEFRMNKEFKEIVIKLDAVMKLEAKQNPQPIEQTPCEQYFQIPASDTIARLDFLKNMFDKQNDMSEFLNALDVAAKTDLQHEHAHYARTFFESIRPRFIM